VFFLFPQHAAVAPSAPAPLPTPELSSAQAALLSSLPGEAVAAAIRDIHPLSPPGLGSGADASSRATIAFAPSQALHIQVLPPLSQAQSAGARLPFPPTATAALPSDAATSLPVAVLSPSVPHVPSPTAPALHSARQPPSGPAPQPTAGGVAAAVSITLPTHLAAPTSTSAPNNAPPPFLPGAADARHEQPRAGGGAGQPLPCDSAAREQVLPPQSLLQQPFQTMSISALPFQFSTAPAEQRTAPAPLPAAFSFTAPAEQRTVTAPLPAAFLFTAPAEQRTAPAPLPAASLFPAPAVQHTAAAPLPAANPFLSMAAPPWPPGPKVSAISSLSALPTLPRPAVAPPVNPFTTAPSPVPLAPPSTAPPAVAPQPPSHAVTPARLFGTPAPSSGDASIYATPRGSAYTGASPSASTSGSFGSSASTLTLPSQVQPSTSQPVAHPLVNAELSPLLASAREVRHIYSEGPTRRQAGGRIIAADGTDSEFAAPLSLALDLDRYIQRRVLHASSLLSEGLPDISARAGVPEEIFESVWEDAARELEGVVSEASGCTQEQAASVISQNAGDCAISMLALLHDKGDSFQQQCAQASAIELKRRRQEVSLGKIVDDAAQQGRLPSHLSSKKMLRALQEHLPLSDIMGHRYRVPAPEQAAPKGRVPKRRLQSRVSFEDGSSSKRRGSRVHDDEDADDVSEDSDSDDGRHSRYGDSDASSFDGGSDDDSEDSSSEEEESEDEGERSSRRKKVPERRSSLMAAPPPNWTDGDSPNGGFYLDTFTRIYQGYKSFTSLHGKSLSFKSLIQHDIEPTVMMELGIRKVSSYQKLSDEKLLKRIKECLGFQEDDYYVRKLELLRLPPCNPSKPSSLYSSFRKLTTPFLRILREAQDSGARLRSTNVSRIFKNHIRGVPALERWFQSKRFKTFNDAVRHISKELHNRIATEVESRHDEMIANGQVAGARSDIRGGKAEPGRGKGFGAGNQGSSRNQQGQSQRSGENGGHPFKRRSQPDDRSSANSRNGRPVRSDAEEAAFQSALAKEKSLPQGMYHHPRGPFCKENPCRAKICQGCNFHAGPDGNGHIRPNCRCKDNPEFVPEGYFHDKYPNRTGALTLPKTSNGSTRPPTSGTQFGPPPTARVRQVAGKGRRSGDQ